jgi:hypothetical protein
MAAAAASAAAVIPGLSPTSLSKIIIKNSIQPKWHGNWHNYNAQLTKYLTPILSNLHPVTLVVATLTGLRAAVDPARLEGEEFTVYSALCDVFMNVDDERKDRLSVASIITSIKPSDPECCFKLYEALQEWYNPRGDQMAYLLETNHDRICQDFDRDWQSFFSKVHNKLEDLSTICRELTEQTSSTKILNAIAKSKIG